jgi:hypothetical protein
MIPAGGVALALWQTGLRRRNRAATG